MATMTPSQYTVGIPGVTAGAQQEDKTPPNELLPTIELPVYGVAAVDRKWWLDQFMSEMDNGQFFNAGRLGDSIKRDGRVLGALEQRKAALFGAPLQLEPANDSALAVKIRDELLAGWERMFPRTELEELHEYATLHGLGIAEKIWDTSKTPWTFRISVRHPQFYLWLWNTGNYHLITLNRALVRVPERSTQWINHAPYGYKRAYLNGRLRALVDPWMMRMWNKNDWANWCEMHGKPIRKAIVPQKADPVQEKQFVSNVSKLGSNTTIKVRRDADGNSYDVELLEAVSMGWKGFQGMMEWSDNEIAQVLLGQTASMDNNGGLNSQEDPGKGVRMDVLAADNAKLCETLYVQALRDYCEFNYGDPDLAPRPNYQVAPPEDEADLAATDQLVAQTLVSFKTAAAPVNVREYLEERGFPLLTPEEEAQQKADAMEQAQQMAALTKPNDDGEGDDSKPAPKKPQGQKPKKK